LWKLPPNIDDAICAALQTKFEFLFQRLNVVNTYDMVLKTVKTEEIRREAPAGAMAAVAKDDVKGLAD
jgi:hypothetical protein